MVLTRDFGTQEVATARAAPDQSAMESVSFGGGANNTQGYSVNGIRGSSNRVELDGSSLIDIGSNSGVIVTLNNDDSRMRPDQTWREKFDGWLRKKATEFPTGSSTLLVTHMPNIAAAFPAWATDVADGEALVLGPDGKGGPTLIARIRIEEWPRLK